MMKCEVDWLIYKQRTCDAGPFDQMKWVHQTPTQTCKWAKRFGALQSATLYVPCGGVPIGLPYWLTQIGYHIGSPKFGSPSPQHKLIPLPFY